MNRFDIERKGYSQKQVDDYIQALEIKYEKQMADQQAVLLQLKSENASLSSRLNDYVQKDGQISNALVVAVETAKEIENSAKTVYELEIQRVKLLYTKWQAVLRQITALYPEINDNSSIYKLFKDFESNIVSILEKENNIETIAFEKGHIGNKSYAKNLLQRIKETDYPTLPSNPKKPMVQIKRSNTKTSVIEKNIEKERKRIEEKKENESIPQISEFEKFMNSEFDDFNAFQSGNTQNKRMHNLYESNLVSSKNEQSGFDLKEALTPTEDLTDIMKIFDLDE